MIFSQHNDTAIAHLFVRLITKTNSPYNKNKLTEYEFNEEYEYLKKYIEWKKIQSQTNNFSLYNFSPKKMSSFLSLISWDSSNENELLKLWKVTMCNVNPRFV
jgi:hypothetical protein